MALIGEIHSTGSTEHITMANIRPADLKSRQDFLSSPPHLI